SLQLSCSMCSLYSKGDDRDLHSFPTRRSSDLSTLKSAVLSRERERTPHCRSVGAPRELREKLADPPRRRFEKRACSWFRNYPSLPAFPPVLPPAPCLAYAPAHP